MEKAIEVRHLTKTFTFPVKDPKTMILFEETEAKFKITLEGYIAVGKILDKVEGRMDALEQKIAMLPTKNEMEGWFTRIIEILDKKVDCEEFDAFKRRLLPIN